MSTLAGLLLAAALEAEAPSGRLGLYVPAWRVSERFPAREGGESGALGAELGVDGSGLGLPAPWWGQLRLRTLAYDEAAGQARQEWQLEAAMTRQLAASGLSLGLGGWLRREAGPGAWRHWLAAGELVGRGEWDLGPHVAVGGVSGWHLKLLGAWAPAVAVWGGGATGVPALAGTRFELGVGRGLGAWRAEIGFRRWWLGGGGYEEVLSGPYVGLSLDDRGWRSGAP